MEGGDSTQMTMLALPQEIEVALELVHSARGSVDPGGLHHLAIQVDDLESRARRRWWTPAATTLNSSNGDRVTQPG